MRRALTRIRDHAAFVGEMLIFVAACAAICVLIVLWSFM
jgi:hypothetical protein